MAVLKARFKALHRDTPQGHLNSSHSIPQTAPDCWGVVSIAALVVHRTAPPLRGTPRRVPPGPPGQTQKTPNSSF